MAPNADIVTPVWSFQQTCALVTAGTTSWSWRLTGARGAELAELYAKRLAPIQGLSVVAGTGSSAQYFVLRVDEASFGSSRDELHNTLSGLNIISRRYFYRCISGRW